MATIMCLRSPASQPHPAGDRADVVEVGALVALFTLDGAHALLRPTPGQLRPADVDVLRTLSDLGQDIDAVREHLAPAPEAGQVPPLSVLPVGELTEAEGGEKGRVPGAHPEVAVLAGGDDLLHLLPEEESLRGHDLERQASGKRHRFVLPALQGLGLLEDILDRTGPVEGLLG